MVDTIILRVHNVQKHKTLIEELTLNKQDGYSVQSAKIDKKELAQLRNAGVDSDKELINILQLKKTGDFLLKTEVGKQMNASNHYSFTYFINYTKDHIEFNFSIPKFKYGSNVLMYVEHDLDREFKYFNCRELDYNIKKAPQLIFYFIRNFFKNEFVYPVSLSDVEVNRIDVCFNQVFTSKSEALLYLEYQKRLRKKYSRNEDGVLRDYATSLMYVSKRYSAKIYHKGSEYEKNDKKEHLKMNESKGYNYFKVDKFQVFADKILRYELTLRNTYLNYLFKYQLFRKKCRIFQSNLKDYKRTEASILRNDRISKKIGSLNDKEKESYLLKHPYTLISRDARKMHKYVSNLINSKTMFMLETDEEIDFYNQYTVPYSCNYSLFSKELVSLCLNKLLQFIEEYKISELPYSDIISRKIDEYNLLHTSKLPKGEMTRFYESLLIYGSFKEAAKFLNLSRATLYRYQSRFKQIGITEKAIKPLTGDGIPSVPLTFERYHSNLMFENQDLLRGITID